MVDKRFLHELPAIIANAIEGEDREYKKIACLNIIQYIKEMTIKCETPNAEAVQYLISALSDLSQSEKERLAKALSVPIDEASPARLLESLPKLSAAATERLVEKLTAEIGRKKLSHENELGNIKIGSEVAKLHAKYKDRNSLHYEETRKLGLEPKERAISEVAEKRNKSKSKIKRMYSLFKFYQDMGSIDEYGKFIIIKYAFILPDQKKK